MWGGSWCKNHNKIFFKLTVGEHGMNWREGKLEGLNGEKGVGSDVIFFQLNIFLKKHCFDSQK